MTNLHGPHGTFITENGLGVLVNGSSTIMLTSCSVFYQMTRLREREGAMRLNEKWAPPDTGREKSFLPWHDNWCAAHGLQNNNNLPFYAVTIERWTSVTKEYLILMNIQRVNSFPSNSFKQKLLPCRSSHKNCQNYHKSIINFPNESVKMTLSVSVYHQPEITRKLGQKFPICLSECNVFQNMLFKSMFIDGNRAWVNFCWFNSANHTPP